MFCIVCAKRFSTAPATFLMAEEIRPEQRTRLLSLCERLSHDPPWVSVFQDLLRLARTSGKMGETTRGRLDTTSVPRRVSSSASAGNGALGFPFNTSPDFVDDSEELG